MARIMDSCAINGTQIQIHIDPDEDHDQLGQPRNPRIRTNSNSKISPINKNEELNHHHQHEIIKTQNTPTTRNLCSNLFLLLFIFQILSITLLTIFLTIHTFFITSHHHHHSFHPLYFYPPLLTSSAFASLFAFISQSSLTLFSSSFSPSKPIKIAFSLAPLSTISFAVLLLAIGSPGSFIAAALALVASFVLALYSCWASPRIHHATNILSSSLPLTSTTHHTNAYCTKLLSITLLIATTHSFLIVSALAGATASQIPIKTVFFFVILLSLTWTMHALRGLVHAQVARIAFSHFTTTTNSNNNNNNRTRLVLALKECLGSVCLGAAVEPVIGVVRGAARAVGVVGGDIDEFMFSCVSCCGGVGGEVVRYGNRWGFVGVGVHGKGFVEASMEAWEMFERCGMVRLIDDDLTGSICFMWVLLVGRFVHFDHLRLITDTLLLWPSMLS